MIILLGLYQFFLLVLSLWERSRLKSANRKGRDGIDPANFEQWRGVELKANSISIFAVLIPFIFLLVIVGLAKSNAVSVHMVSLLLIFFFVLCAVGKLVAIVPEGKAKRLRAEFNIAWPNPEKKLAKGVNS